jgi:hypothetical protein
MRTDDLQFMRLLTRTKVLENLMSPTNQELPIGAISISQSLNFKSPVLSSLNYYYTAIKSMIFMLLCCLKPDITVVSEF